MTTAYADDAVVALLEPLTSPVVLTANANLFLGPMRQPEDGVPTKCVFVVQQGQTRDAVLVYEQVLVEVRADRSDYAGGLALARACEVALHCPTMPSGWSDIQVPSGPFYAQTDADGRHVWRLLVAMVRALRT